MSAVLGAPPGARYVEELCVGDKIWHRDGAGRNSRAVVSRIQVDRSRTRVWVSGGRVLIFAADAKVEVIP